ncbi:tetratricopeptide repeat protein [Eilatimonas milleporae]|uniref:Tetratricopeptide repeat protein n=1 Tax=Eilatimonas milleporae TaxID=911205 RepID=A0A3M0CG10_9PROT|nr:tetratricopeptide repeat protein [Eilatimonas milleporae]RMB08524.1 tetratricopeptide repeat protein [Eilatimonas milleporae]
MGRIGMAVSALGIFILAHGTGALAHQTASKFQALSKDLTTEATSALSAADAERAQGLYERALVADPANVQALIGLGRAHEAQGRVGRSLKYYRHALELEPNELTALEAQALAFLKRDLVDRAKRNRDKLARLCLTGCTALTSVDEALSQYEATETAEAETQGR